MRLICNFISSPTSISTAMLMTLPNTKRHEIDTLTKNCIVGRTLETGNAAQAGHDENVNPCTAQHIIKRYQKIGSTSNKPRPGCPQKLNHYDKHQILRTALKQCRAPFQVITNQISTHVSVSTICNVLAQYGYHRQVARRVPYLMCMHRHARLNWARINKLFTQQNYWRVIFSDECYMYLGDNCGHIYVTWRADEEFDEGCLVPTFKQLAVRVMVWGCIIEGRKGHWLCLSIQEVEGEE